MTSYFDSHCHLDRAVFKDELEAVITRARAAGVRWLTTIGSDDGVAYAEQAVAIAASHEDVFATVGVHPHNAKACTDEVFDAIARLARRPEVVAIGEAGLDYHYDLSPRDEQQAVFRRFIALAHEVDKPLVIHVREAFDDCLRLLDEGGADRLRVVIHCFTGSRAEADACLARGFWLSIPGIVTFRSAGEIPEVAKTAPLDKLLVETDCPYLAPIPHRGKRNEPAFIVHTAAKVAELRGMTPDALAEATARNALAFYGIG